MDDHESLSKADVIKMANINHLTSQIDEFILQRQKQRSNLGRLWSASFSDVATAVLEAVVPTASRWKDLTVRVDRSSLDDLIRMDPGPFAALETLDLVTKDDDLWPEDVACMPFARLTHLNLVESNPTTCHRILLQCTNLLSATLRTISWETAGNVAAPATELPFLEILKMGYSDIRARWAVIRIIRVPNAEPKHLAHSLSECWISSAELVTLWRLAPALTALTLSLCPHCIDDDFLRALTYDETRAQTLVPHLQELEWAAIRSRCWTGDAAPPGVVARLKTVTLEGYLFNHLRNRMQDLIEQVSNSMSSANHWITIYTAIVTYTSTQIGNTMKTYAVRLKVLAQATSPLFRKAPSIFAALECNTRCVMLKEHADFIPIRPQKKIYSEDTTHFLARILPYTFTSAPQCRWHGALSPALVRRVLCRTVVRQQLPAGTVLCQRSSRTRP
ncbi:hypothetical protein B0H14DRAFT_3858463 [Mycena olivaceomarginata]|nr:hypothetical protein B0H14DRAFT_3858463 [Mycena olivaceomarginata]